MNRIMNGAAAAAATVLAFSAVTIATAPTAGAVEGTLNCRPGIVNLYAKATSLGGGITLEAPRGHIVFQGYVPAYGAQGYYTGRTSSSWAAYGGGLASAEAFCTTAM